MSSLENEQTEQSHAQNDHLSVTVTREPPHAQNDHLSVTVTREPHCQVKLDVRVSPKATRAAHHKAIKNINKEVSIPGFRKGKAPDSFLLKKYASAIEKEFFDIVLQTGFEEAIHLLHLHPLKDGHFERPVIHSCSPAEGAHFTVAFELRPSIPLVDVTDLHLKRLSPPPITEENLENAAHNLQLQFATYEPVEGRSVQEGDFIDATLAILSAPPRNIMNRQRVLVKAAELPPWFSKTLFSLGADESAEGMTEPNPEHPDPDFQPAPFRLTVHAIWQGTLPTLDDDLARRAGSESLDQLYKKIEEHLRETNEEETFQLLSESLDRLLTEKHPFEVPKSYIDANRKTRVQNYRQQIHEQGHSQRESPGEREWVDQRIEHRVIHDLRLFFLMQKIALTHDIRLDEEDILEEWRRQARLLPLGKSILNAEEPVERQRERLQSLAFDRKVRKFLLQHVTFTD